MHSIQKINQNNISYGGKFIFAENMSQKECKTFTDFINKVLDSKSNKDIIRKKPYDIYVYKSDRKSDMFRFFTSFKSVFSDKKRDVYISSLNLKNNINGEIHFFRSELEWFEKYKKISCGYNNLREKILAIFKI